MTADLLHALRERVKELTALHATARILQDGTKPLAEVMQALAALLPSAWQYPEITAARIRYQELQADSPGFAESAWRQAAAFTTRDGRAGSIEVFYLEARPPADEGPFLKEERDLIDSLAEMLSSYFQHKLASDALQRAHDELEMQVRARTGAAAAAGGRAVPGRGARAARHRRGPPRPHRAGAGAHQDGAGGAAEQRGLLRLRGPDRRDEPPAGADDPLHAQPDVRDQPAVALRARRWRRRSAAWWSDSAASTASP